MANEYKSYETVYGQINPNENFTLQNLYHYVWLTLLETTLRELAQKGDSKRTRIYCNLGSYFQQECHWYLSKRVKKRKIR